MTEAPDPVFAAEMVGPGVAIDPDPGEVTVVSPIAGKIVKLHPHAFVVLDRSGVGVLVHLGINTVRLEGKGFEVIASEGATVAAGDPIVRWDPAHHHGRGHLDPRPGGRDGPSEGLRPAARRWRRRGHRRGAVHRRRMIPAALLLDLDGTLVDTEPMNRSAYRAFFAARGWDEPDLVALRRPPGGGRLRLHARTVDRRGPGGSRGRGARTDRPGRRTRTVPGADDLLAEAARRGIPVAIVTSAGPEWVRRSAAGPLTALAGVDVVVTAADVVDGKPDPACYLLACERLGVDPASAMAVEDSPAGVRAAVDAGVGRVVAVTSTHEASDLAAAGAEPVVASLTAVPELWTAPDNGVNLGG